MQRILVCVNKAWAIVVCMLFVVTVHAQTDHSYFFRSITQEDGLAHDNVFGITQDSRGFIWVATQNGVQRYDGTRFLGFHDILNSPMPSAQGQVSLSADNKNDLLWLSNTVNTESIDPSNNRFTPFKPEDVLQQSPERFQKYVDHNNYPWMIGNNAIFNFNYLTKQFHFSSFNGNPVARGVSNIFVTNKQTGETWMGGNTEGLILFDDKTRKAYTTENNPLKNPVLLDFQKHLRKQKYPISKVMLDRHDNLWIATWGRTFFKFDAQSERLISYSLTDYSDPQAKAGSQMTPVAVTCFYEDHHGMIWIGTENGGLLRYRESTGGFETILIDTKNSVRDFSEYKISCIFEDSEENIWLGTNQGIRIFNPYRQFFRSVHHNEDNKASLPKSEIDCYIQTPSGDILVGTWGGGITLFDSKWNFKKNFEFRGQPEFSLVWSFITNDDGKIWAGCQHGYIHIYNPERKTFETIHPGEMDNSTIRCMARDGIGNLWFGLHNGRIAQWNKAKNKFVRYNAPASADGVVYPPVTNLFFDNKQQCWVGTYNGFAKFETGQMLISKTYRPDEKQPHRSSAAVITGIEQYDDSTLIIGSVYGGIKLFHISSGTFTQPSFGAEKIPHSVYAVKKDAAGLLWFTTDYGLYAFRPGTDKLISYRIESGMLNASFKDAGFYALKDGTWITSTSTEILGFNPVSNPPSENTRKRVEITGLKLFDTAVQIDSLLKLDQPIRLSYKDNFLTIEWSGTDFLAARQNQYFYRLVDVNKEWINAGGKTFAGYTNLAPGNYVFEVKKGDGQDFTGVSSLKIIIAPPFWKTGWFAAFMVLLVGMVIYFLTRWRLNGLRAIERSKIKVQQAQIEVLSMNEKLSLARLEALRSQMNPHFIFNCLTSIDNLIETGEKDKATSYLAKFAKLIRSILETSKLNHVACWKDIEMLRMYLEMEALRCDGKFRYTINVSEEILHGDYKVPPLVIQPFVENAIHHGLLNKNDPDKELIIDVSASENVVHYIIRDNGVGRAQAEKYKQINRATHQSMGMQITVDRIELFNKNNSPAVIITDLYSAGKQPAGTQVEVTLVNE